MLSASLFSSIPKNPRLCWTFGEMELAARSLDVELHEFGVGSVSEFESAFVAMAQKGVTRSQFLRTHFLTRQGR